MSKKTPNKSKASQVGKAWRKETPLWFWKEGKVDPAGEHIELRYGNAHKNGWDEWIPVARLGKAVGIEFSVQWLLKRKSPRNAPNDQ